MTDLATVAGVLQTASLQATEPMALTPDLQAKNRLRPQTLAAVAHDSFGAPAMFVNGMLCCGGNRLDFVRQALSA